VRDKLNISDIPGAKPDVYKGYRNIEGREYIDPTDIDGAKPSQLKQNKPHTGPDYKLYTKDINPDKWTSKRVVDPLKPEYEVPTKSGRMMRIG
jgi:phosphoglycerol transferase MdoB-like AlkP superfamily enzyme